MADAPPGTQLQPSMPRPPWMTARDRELWDALVYDGYDNGGPLGDTPLTRRHTLTIGANTARTVDVCLPRQDQNYTGERLAPYASEQWWKRHIERWTGVPWNGDVTVGNCLRFYSRIINVREGDPDQMTASYGPDVLATAGSTRAPDRWMSGEIEFNPDGLRRAEDFQVEAALAHELGHILGFWHTPPGTGFVMDSEVVTSPQTWPAKERYLSQLAYEVGPDVDYPGLTGATPVPALPFLDGLFRWLMK